MCLAKEWKKAWGKDIETGHSLEHQLYDLSKDPGEQKNVANNEQKNCRKIFKNYEPGKT